MDDQKKMPITSVIIPSALMPGLFAYFRGGSILTAMAVGAVAGFATKKVGKQDDMTAQAVGVLAGVGAVLWF